MVIAADGRYGMEGLLPYRAAVSRLHPRVCNVPALVRSIQAAVGGALLRSPAFTRHVVLDPWFPTRG